jgi:MFS family permease
MLARERQADLARRVEGDRRVQAIRASRQESPPLGLSQDLWLVVLGIFVNYVGYGAVLPFEIIYLHDGRGFSLGVAGLVVGLITGVAVVTAPISGPLIDGFGARTVTVFAGVTLAVGYGGLAFARSPAQALLAAAVAGAGNGALNPSQSTLLTTLAPADLRHRATAVSRVAANAGAAIGAGLGGLVAACGLAGFVALFLANGVTYLVYVVILVTVVRDVAPPEPAVGGYRVVIRDRVFLRLAITNVAIIAVGWGVFTWLVPPYAEDNLGLPTQLIGGLLFANAATVAVTQLPIARLAEGRRRVVMMSAAAWIFVGACLLVVVAGAAPGVAYVALFAATILVGIGECLHTAVVMPLVADLAPSGLRGRYMATMGLSWWFGLAVAPALGAVVLDVSPIGAFLAAAAVACAAAVSALALEPSLPDASRRTPHPRIAGHREE